MQVAIHKGVLLKVALKTLQFYINFFCGEKTRQLYQDILCSLLIEVYIYILSKFPFALRI